MAGGFNSVADEDGSPPEDPSSEALEVTDRNGDGVVNGTDLSILRSQAPLTAGSALVGGLVVQSPLSLGPMAGPRMLNPTAESEQTTSTENDGLFTGLVDILAEL